MRLGCLRVGLSGHQRHESQDFTGTGVDEESIALDAYTSGFDDEHGLGLDAGFVKGLTRSEGLQGQLGSDLASFLIGQRLQSGGVGQTGVSKVGVKLN